MTGCSPLCYVSYMFLPPVLYFWYNLISFQYAHVLLFVSRLFPELSFSGSQFVQHLPYGRYLQKSWKQRMLAPKISFIPMPFIISYKLHPGQLRASLSSPTLHYLCDCVLHSAILVKTCLPKCSFIILSTPSETLSHF